MSQNSSNNESYSELLAKKIFIQKNPSTYVELHDDGRRPLAYDYTVYDKVEHSIISAIEVTSFMDEKIKHRQSLFSGKPKDTNELKHYWRVIINGNPFKVTINTKSQKFDKKLKKLLMLLEAIGWDQLG